MKTNTTEKPTHVGLVILALITIPLYLIGVLVGFFWRAFAAGLGHGSEDWDSATDNKL